MMVPTDVTNICVEMLMILRRRLSGVVTWGGYTHFCEKRAPYRRCTYLGQSPVHQPVYNSSQSIHALYRCLSWYVSMSCFPHPKCSFSKSDPEASLEPMRVSMSKRMIHQVVYTCIVRLFWYSCPHTECLMFASMILDISMVIDNLSESVWSWYSLKLLDAETILKMRICYPSRVGNEFPFWSLRCLFADECAWGGNFQYVTLCSSPHDPMDTPDLTILCFISILCRKTCLHIWLLV